MRKQNDVLAEFDQVLREAGKRPIPTVRKLYSLYSQVITGKSDSATWRNHLLARDFIWVVLESTELKLLPGDESLLREMKIDDFPNFDELRHEIKGTLPEQRSPKELMDRMEKAMLPNADQVSIDAFLWLRDLFVRCSKKQMVVASEEEKLLLIDALVFVQDRAA